MSQISVQLYTVREAIANDLPAALERIAAIGFTNVEPYGFVERAEEYAEHLGRLGLRAPSAHSALIGQDLAPIFDAAATIGVSTLIDPYIEPALWTTAEDVAASASALNEIARAAADRGLRIGYHNHYWELENKIDGVSALEVLADRLDEAVVLEVDTYWSEVGGMPAAGLLERLGERVQFIHVKDGPATLETKHQVAVGSGRIPVLEILAAAPQAVRVVELDDFDGDIFEALADSLAFLKSNGVAA